MEKVSGVYMIKNLVTGRVYIGSSGNIKSRWRTHKDLLKHRKHHNSYLQNSYNKHGIGAFKFSIIEKCEKEELEIREQYWYEYYKENGKVYNIRNDVRTCRGFKHSEKTKQKISESHSGEKHYLYGKSLSEETKRKISLAKKGKKQTEEAKRKLSESNKGKKPKKQTIEASIKVRKGKHLSEEHKHKISLKMKGRKISNEKKEQIRNTLKGHIVTEETKKKISEAQKGKKRKPVSEETKNKLRGKNNPMYGKHHTEETKRKIRETNKGRKLSEEQVQKIRELWKNKEYREHMKEVHKKNSKEENLRRY